MGKEDHLLWDLVEEVTVIKVCPLIFFYFLIFLILLLIFILIKMSFSQDTMGYQ